MLRLKNEIFKEELVKNNISIDSSTDSCGEKLSLVEEYQQKLYKIQ